MRSRRKKPEKDLHIGYVLLAVIPILCLSVYVVGVNFGWFDPHRGKTYEIDFEVWSVQPWKNLDYPPTWRVGTKGSGVFNLRGNVTQEGLTKGSVWWVKYSTKTRDLRYTPVYTVIEMERIK